MRWSAMVPEWFHYQEGQLVCPNAIVESISYWSDGSYKVKTRDGMRHLWYYSRCLNCSAEYSAQWEGSGIVPRLSDLNPDNTATWAAQIEKGSIARQPFWLHDMKPRKYENDQGQEVAIIVCDITVGGPSRRNGRAVIVLGHTEERQAFLDYFEAARADVGGGIPEPIGPCITYEVPMKGGRSFWRLEDAPDDEDQLPGMTDLGETSKRRK